MNYTILFFLIFITFILFLILQKTRKVKKVKKVANETFLKCENIALKYEGGDNSNYNLNVRALQYWIFSEIIRKTFFFGDIGNLNRANIFLDYFYDNFNGPKGILAKKFKLNYEQRKNVNKEHVIIQKSLYKFNILDAEHGSDNIHLYSEIFHIKIYVINSIITDTIKNIKYQYILKKLGLTIPHTMFWKIWMKFLRKIKNKF